MRRERLAPVRDGLQSDGPSQPERHQAFRLGCANTVVIRLAARGRDGYHGDKSERKDCMGYSANDTAQKHERILNESIRLFRERGFSGVSVDDVMKSAGLTHGPFYNHFASKEALMAETLTHEMQRFIGALDSWPPTEEGIAQYADHYLSEEHMNDRGMGCAIAALASEVSNAKQVRRAFTEQFKGVIQKLATRFPWRSRRSSRGDAIHMYSAMVGALILARAVDDRDFAKEILTEARKRVA
jgi:TetR/AcrR family transcriptional repressor of nem operon